MIQWEGRQNAAASPFGFLWGFVANSDKLQKGKGKELLALENRIIDFHSHILPGLDHGSPDLATTLSQLRLMAKHKTTDVVATSHFYPQKERVDAFLSRREKAISLLRPALEPEMPRIYIGAEVLLCAGMENMKELHKLCIAGTDVLLLERPFLPLTEELCETVYRITKLGYTVVLAHIDRYPPKETCSLLFPQVKAQVNASALSSFFGRRKLLPFFRDGMVAALGSDLHNAPDSYNAFPEAKKRLKPYFDAVMQESEGLLRNATPLR